MNLLEYKILLTASKTNKILQQKMPIVISRCAI